MERSLSALTAVSIIAALVFAVLAFGGVEPWAYSVVAVLAYTALAAAVAMAIVTRRARALITPMLLPAVLALLLIGAQLIEWPVGLLEAVSPRTVEIYQDAASPAEAGQSASALSPSLYPHATRDALIRLSAYIALFVATCAYVRSRKHIASLASAIIAIGFAISLFGIVQNISGTRKLYWWREMTYGGALFGPFVSRNQFASYAGVCLFVGLGLLVARGARAAGSVRRRQKGLRRALSGHAHQSFLMVYALAVIGAAVIWSLSRGGILSLLLSFAGVLVALRATGLVRSRLLYVGAVAIAILGWVTYLGWEPVLNRLSTLERVARDPLGNWRWMMCSDAVRMGLKFPITGTGAGTFLSVYPLYRTLPTHSVTVSPHNEYVHVFAESGFAGLAVLLLAMALLYGRVIGGLARGKNSYMLGFLTGGIGALLMVSFHSMVDFPMRSPAIAATVI
jgi:O-antigen ligase